MSSVSMQGSERLIPWDELAQIVPYTIQHIYRLERRGEFPRRVRIGKRRVAWVHSEVMAWVEARKGERVETRQDVAHEVAEG